MDRELFKVGRERHVKLVQEATEKLRGRLQSGAIEDLRGYVRESVILKILDLAWRVVGLPGYCPSRIIVEVADRNIGPGAAETYIKGELGVTDEEESMIHWARLFGERVADQFLATESGDFFLSVLRGD